MGIEKRLARLEQACKPRHHALDEDIHTLLTHLGIRQFSASPAGAIIVCDPLLKTSEQAIDTSHPFLPDLQHVVCLPDNSRDREEEAYGYH